LTGKCDRKLKILKKVEDTGLDTAVPPAFSPTPRNSSAEMGGNALPDIVDPIHGLASSYMFSFYYIYVQSNPNTQHDYN
jgi:hypothetical protein